MFHTSTTSDRVNFDKMMGVNLWFSRHWHVLLLLVQPLLMTLINPNWLYNPPVLNTFDTWVYNSVFRYLPDFATAQHVDFFYFMDRLSWVLPGYILYHLFSPEIANALLHFGVYALALFSIYGISKQLFGQDAAFLMAICLGGYTWFLRAVGHDYVDGVGIAYYSVALWFATQAVYQYRYKLYLMGCGAFLALTLVTQLLWVVFIPLIALYYLILNHHHARRPLVINMAWVSFGVIGVLVVLMLASWVISGEWNIFINSVALITKIGSLHDLLLGGLIGIYGKIPATWLVLPCVIAILAAIQLTRSKNLTPTLRLHIRLIVGGFCLTIGIFIGFQIMSSLPYLIVYVYTSMMIPATFLLLAALIATAEMKAITPVSALMLIAIILIQPFIIILIEPFETFLLNPNIVWPVTAVALLILSLSLTLRKQPLGLVSGFTIMSMMFGGSNGVFYHDRLKNYTIFTSVNHTIEAITRHHPSLDDFSEAMVWYEATTFLTYGAPVIYIYWGGSNWGYVQTHPTDLRLVADITQDVVMLSDNPAIDKRVQFVLDGQFSVTLLRNFALPNIDPTGRYRGYVLRLLRLDTYNQPIFPTGYNVFKSRYDYVEPGPAITGPGTDVVFQFRLPTPNSDFTVAMCVVDMTVPVPNPLPALLNDTPIEFVLSDSEETGACRFYYMADVPQTAISNQDITKIAMNIPVGKVNSSSQGLHIASIMFSENAP